MMENPWPRIANTERPTLGVACGEADIVEGPSAEGFPDRTLGPTFFQLL